MRERAVLSGNSVQQLHHNLKTTTPVVPQSQAWDASPEVHRDPVMPRHTAWFKKFTAPEVSMGQKLRSQREQDITISMGTSCPCSRLRTFHMPRCACDVKPLQSSEGLSHAWHDVTLLQPSVGVPHALLRLPLPALCPLLWLSSLPHPPSPAQPPPSHSYSFHTNTTRYYCPCHWMCKAAADPGNCE